MKLIIKKWWSNLKSSILVTYRKFLKKDKLSNLLTYKTFKRIVIGDSISKKLLRIYILLLIICACLLYTPIALKPFMEEGWGGPIYNLHYENNAYVFNGYNDGTFNGVNQEFRYDFLDCFFSSSSAFSDTGLTIGITDQIFSVFGKVVILFSIQIGGFGIMFFVFLIWKFFGKFDKLTINQTLLAQAERGNVKVGNTPKMLITSAIAILLIEVIFAFFYTFWFYAVPADVQSFSSASEHFTTNKLYFGEAIVTEQYHNWGSSFFTGFFHSVSSINNAGFDIVSDYSLAPYRNGIHSIFLLVTTLQFIIGGFGFPIIYDLMQKFHFANKRTFISKRGNFKFIWIGKLTINRSYRISLLTKISSTSYICLLIFGIIFAFLFECTSLGGGSNYLWTDTTTAFGTNGSERTYNKVVQIIFQATSSRSAGFSTIGMEQVNPSTKMLMSFLMFVGGAPSSTAGGIRTTTFAICILAIWARLKGNSNINAFKRTLNPAIVIKASIVSFVALILVAIGSVIITTSLTNLENPSLVFTNAIFLNCSAFGTSGLSTIDIGKLSQIAKVYLIFIMFIGQYGVTNSLLAFNKNKLKLKVFKYGSEDVIIG